ncbi:MAG: tetratricopeptide repeat protein [Deltaproteobacteria bacterium]|nr:tetratricopeptide repeat protein [Deltaproteobacteria bacterium]
MIDRILEKNLNIFLILAGLVIISYVNSLWNPFIWDDKVLIPENTGIQEGWKSVVTAFSPRLWGLRADNEAFQSFYRPTHTLLSILDYQIWGLRPFGYHLSNTILHLANTILIFFLAVKITGERLTALLAASIFAVHPVHTESVTFISARPDLLAAFFMLISFLLYASRTKGEGAANYSIRYGVSLIAFGISLFSKEMSVTYPLLLAFYAWLVEDKGGRVKRVVPYFIILAAYILFRVSAMSEFLVNHKMRAGFFTVIQTSMVAVFDYIRLLIIPFPLHAYYDLIWYSGFSFKFLFAVLLLLIAGAGAVFLLILGKKRPAYALIWTFLALAPVLNIGTLGDFSIAERYLYLPSIGYSILAAMAILTLRQTSISKAVPAIVTAMLVVFIVLTAYRNHVWGDDYLFYSDMAKGAPNSAIPHANLAHAYLRRGNVQGGIEELEKTLIIAKNNYTLHNELGMVYGKAGKFADAVQHFRTAVDLKPDYIDAYIGLGMSYMQLGNAQYAKTAFEAALEIDPNSEIAAAGLSRISGTK